MGEIHTFSFRKMHLKMSSEKWPLFCLGADVLTFHDLVPWIHGNRTSSALWFVVNNEKDNENNLIAMKFDHLH